MEILCNINKKILGFCEPKQNFCVDHPIATSNIWGLKNGAKNPH